MSFSKNNIGNVRIDDPMLHLTKAQLSYLKKSWAGAFYEKIFKNIDESRFAVLYKDGRGRYNNPINETVGMLIIKEISGKTNSYIVNESALDLKYKYALGCTNKAGAPVKQGMMTKFRKKLKDYKKETGVDLLADELAKHSEAIAEIKEKYTF